MPGSASTGKSGIETLYGLFDTLGNIGTFVAIGVLIYLYLRPENGSEKDKTD